MNQQMSFKELLVFYENHLFQDVMPFWVKHCIDWKFGGLNNMVEDNGSVVSTDKFMWSQGRALWTFSALYNSSKDSRWLEIAHNIANFIMKHRPDSNEGWPFKLHQDGTTAVPPQSIYVDAFIIYGLTEYARATLNREAIDLALTAYKRTSPLLQDHSTIPTSPHPIPEGLQAHGPLMIFAITYHDLGILTNREDILNRAMELAEIIMNQHLKPERQILFEFVKHGGELVDTDAGKTFIPGHIIESMWFMERIYRHHRRFDRIELALEAIRWSLEKGWDEEYGGLFLACHTQGGRPIWYQPDAKAWWPITESLYALLRSYEISGKSWCIDWYWKIHDYAFHNYPNLVHGEWHQNLDRFGNKIGIIEKNIAVKDPFHLPRALIYSINTLRNLEKIKSNTE